MTAAEEQLVAELAEALEDQFSYATQYATIVVDWREEAEALLPVVLADRRRAVAEALAVELRYRADGITSRATEADDAEVQSALDDEAARLNARADAVEGGS